MPKTENEQTEEWVRSRYGPIAVSEQKFYTARVPVMGGEAFGFGLSPDEAIESLYRDLTRGLK